MRFEDETLQDQVVKLDGNAFIRCRFLRCDILFNATAPFVLSNCHFDVCRFSFGGGAAMTLNALSTLYHGGLQPVIEDTFKNIAAAAVQVHEIAVSATGLQPQPTEPSCNWSYSTSENGSALQPLSATARAPLTIQVSSEPSS